MLGRRSSIYTYRCFSNLVRSSSIVSKLNTPMASSYDPVHVETHWQEYWEKLPKSKKPSTGTYSLLLPPPNVTGILHIGHALTITIQDALARYHRMHGKEVMWIPGLDHAGIATQSVVRKALMKQGLSIDDMTRKEFISHVWKWHEKHKNEIWKQCKALGVTWNWKEEFFTLDGPRSHAVTEAFVKLHQDGHIYRAKRMIHWCPHLQTALSDIEIDEKQLLERTPIVVPGHASPVLMGVMYRFKYKLAGDQAEQCLEVDTTRPETILGDVAVAVHPEDSRYIPFHGKHVIHPFSGELLPIVCDAELVNMEMGTGVVKITPSHDANDHACSIRHKLSIRQIMSKQATMECKHIPGCEAFHDMSRFDAREAVLQGLKDQGLYIDAYDHPTSIDLCSRSGDIIEPMLQSQWFVTMEDMAKRAKTHVSEGETILRPSSPHTKTWNHWLDNIQDWCISRQLWWGHRIPAYRVLFNDNNTAKQHDVEWIVARSLSDAHQQVEEKYNLTSDEYELHQDEDVLDTWFSSSLLPLSALGWPHQDVDGTLQLPKESQKFYPLSVLETGQDILFFWVARMSMICSQLVGTVPFKEVLLHPMVRDKTGTKMSKSLGNVINPSDVIQGIALSDMLHGLQSGNLDPTAIKASATELSVEFPSGIPQCGADSLRFTLASYMQQGRQINMDVQRAISNRQFGNKIWNAVRYTFVHLPEQTECRPTDAPSWQETLSERKEGLPLAERWILSRLARAVKEFNAGMENFQIASSTSAIHHFFLHDLCDVYIEFTKPILQANTRDNNVKEAEDTIFVLFTCLDLSLRMLHPFLPFLSEELWQRLQRHHPIGRSLKEESILETRLPTLDEMEAWENSDVECSLRLVLDVMHAVRSLKQTCRKVCTSVDALGKVPLILVCTEPNDYRLLKMNHQEIITQCGTTDLQLLTSSTRELESGLLVHSLSDTCKVYIPIPPLASLDVTRLSKELKRVEKKRRKLVQQVETLRHRLSLSSFLAQAPSHVIAQEEEKKTQLEQNICTLTDNHSCLVAMLHQPEVNKIGKAE